MAAVGGHGDLRQPANFGPSRGCETTFEMTGNEADLTLLVGKNETTRALPIADSRRQTQTARSGSTARASRSTLGPSTR
jgi:hypothetical protein